MGRIKGWKKRYGDTWESVSDTIISISSASAYLGTWEVSIQKKGKKTFTKDFQYKEDARAFATDYMKKHPKG